MKTSREQNRLHTFIRIGLIIPAIWLNGIQTTHAEDSSQGQAAQRAYIDPDTKKFLKQPKLPPAADNASEKAAFKTSDEGLVEEPSPVEKGGSMVDLKGRFRSPSTAEVDKDGKVIITHKPINPITTDKK